MAKFKHCPFCGGEATLRQFADVYYVTCNGCGCETELCNTVEDAVKLWESRDGIDEEKQIRDDAYWQEKNDGGYYYFVCTNCGKESPKLDDDYHSDWLSDYCPNCGARMRGAVGKTNG